MENDTSTDPATCRIQHDQGDSTQLTSTLSLPSATNKTIDTLHGQETSRTAISTATFTKLTVTVTSLADLRPGTEVQFRILDEVDAQTIQDVRITHTPKVIRHGRKSIQMF